MKSFDTSLYLVTDRSGMGDCEFESKIRSAVEGGCTMVQLREKNINSYLMYQRALSIKKITDEYHIPLIINDRLDIMLAVGADGVHLGQQDIPVKIVRRLIGKDKIIGVSAHCPEEAEKAGEAGEAGGRGETEPAKAAAAKGNVIAYGAVVFDGEPAYDAIEGAWLTDGEYVVLHRMAVADGEKGRGVATEFMRRVEAMAHGRGTGSMRVDTNFDNRYMLRMLGRLGFVYCGKVRYRSGERLAFEKPLGT